MKVSVSSRGETARGSSGLTRFAWVAGVLYLFGHLPFLPPSLEDIDSVNFALALREFDPGQHQPHPPGYPIYIALGRASLAAFDAVSPPGDPVHGAAFALAVWSALAGLVAVVAAARVFASLAGAEGRVAAWALLLTMATPLFWTLGLRPLSDLPGLALVLTAQALLLRSREACGWLVPGAFMATFAVGLRSQAVWLTLPLLAWQLFAHRKSGERWLIVRAIAAATAGVAVWLIPLIVASGGAAAYLRALGTQAGEDIAWVDMLWLNPTPRQLAWNLYHTFVLPWASPVLAAAVLTMAAAGAIVMCLRHPSRFGLLAAAFGPYLAFHLLFQETVTVRYALPTVPAVAFLAAHALAASGRFAMPLAVPLVGAAAIVALDGASAYASHAHPAFRALGDMARRAEAQRPHRVFGHYGVRRAMHARSWQPLPLVEPRPRFEWLGPVEFWKNGGTGAVWFLADARRTDLALIDPLAMTDVVHYAWAVEGRTDFSGTRPMAVRWHRLDNPEWFAGEGWALTPETAGVARATGKGPDHGPIEGFVRKRPSPVRMLIGGRHLGTTADGAAAVEVAVDGIVVDRWEAAPAPREFLRVVDLPRGTGTGDGYARITIACRAADGSARRVPCSIEQFDAGPPSRLMLAFAQGWHEEEYAPASGRRWRWTSDRATLMLIGGAGPVRLTLRGESPMKYFDAAPRVRVTAAGRALGEWTPQRDWEIAVTIPRDVLDAAHGQVVVETDRVYHPDASEGSVDRRALGLRVFDARVSPVP